MTSPARLKRRQQIIGSALVGLGIFTVAITFYFRAQDVAQRECVAEQFQQLADSFTARSTINTRDSVSTTTVIRSVAAASTEAQVREALRAFEETQEQIAKDRKENPVPPLPPGRCE